MLPPVRFNNLKRRRARLGGWQFQELLSIFFTAQFAKRRFKGLLGGLRGLAELL